MSLNGTYDPANIFAKILRGDIPAAKVFEDDNVLAFMDVFPQTPGHTLVIPKRAGRNILDTDEAELVHVMRALKKITAAVKTAFEPDGITLLQYNGEPAGQTVFHIHFHIIPRYEGQELAGHGHGNMADAQELQMQAAKIAAALA